MLPPVGGGGQTTGGTNRLHAARGLPVCGGATPPTVPQCMVTKHVALRQRGRPPIVSVEGLHGSVAWPVRIMIEL
jgi:hypothetical protein